MDNPVNRLFWFVFASSKGGHSRMRIISIIHKKPQNTNQLTKEVGLAYKVIQHHIKILEENNIIIKKGEKYGRTYFVSPLLLKNKESFNEITKKLKIDYHL